MANHLIIGGNGYVGSAMTSYLVNKGESVRVLDINEPKKTYLNVEYIKGDICNKKTVKIFMHDIEYVHFYAVHIPFLAKKDEILKVNIDGLKNVLDESVNSGIKKVLIVSSSTIYGANRKVPVTDECEAIPLDIYGKVRLEAEKLAMKYTEKGLRVVIFRPHIIAGGEREGIFKNIFENIKVNKNIWIPSTSKYIHQFIHIDDLISAISLSFDYDYSDTFNIGQEMEHTMYELVQNVIKSANSKSKVRLIPKFMLSIFSKIDSFLETSILGPNKILIKDNGFYFDCSKIKTSLKWKAEYSDYQTIEESYYNYVKHHS